MIALWLPSCRKSKTCEEPKPDCSTIHCIAHFDYFEFRLLDKETGEDLVFSSNPRYITSEIKLFADPGKTMPLSLTADSDRKTFKTGQARENMWLELEGSQVFKLTVSFMINDCCSNRVKSITIDGKTVCSCCDQIIPIKVQ